MPDIDYRAKVDILSLCIHNFRLEYRIYNPCIYSSTAVLYSCTTCTETGLPPHAITQTHAKNGARRDWVVRPVRVPGGGCTFSKTPTRASLRISCTGRHRRRRSGGERSIKTTTSSLGEATPSGE